MTVNEAKKIGIEWVADYVGTTTNLHGAFFHGSINWMHEQASFSPTSDLDIILVSDEDVEQPRKLLYKDIILDVSWLSVNDVASASAVLQKYWLAGDFRTDNVIADPTGQLKNVQCQVAKEYYTRHQVITRCEAARQNVINFLDTSEKAEKLHDKVTSWLFGRGVMTHVLLNAGTQNPTVKRRYTDTRTLLEFYNESCLYEQLIHTCGFDAINKVQAREYSHVVADFFDTAVSVIRSPYRFSADLQPQTRHLSLDAIAVMISDDLHREAMFWIIATLCRAMHVIDVDASPGIRDSYEKKFINLIATAGIPGNPDLPSSNTSAKKLLPAVWDVAMEIVEKNVKIVS